MEYDWNIAKAAKNLKKHKVSFEEAASVFGDPLAYTFPDPDHSEGEHRLLTFGLSVDQRILVVSHLEHPRGIRIISARMATTHERKIYES
ncbi:BrnT family toxin [Hydrocarboniphaga sp.]|uniref:BrnT family toxin n=1 Tax=Hydrocarboniphaga sp. TaxID=2033016 RepID=UPI003D10D00E